MPDDQACEGIDYLRINPAATGSISRLFAILHLGVILRSEVNAGLNDQRIGIGLETLRIHLGVKPIRV